jgi:hypothetical protein
MYTSQGGQEGAHVPFRGVSCPRVHASLQPASEYSLLGSSTGAAYSYETSG